MVESNISLYSNVYPGASNTLIPFPVFLENIQSGKWQSIVTQVRSIDDPEQRDKAKQNAPAVTIAGVFNDQHTDAGIVKHSTFIAIDVDKKVNPDLDTTALKLLLSKDKYVVSSFVSIGGEGVCIILHINPAKHREAFQGACQYIYEQYKIVCDPTSVNPSRLRFVSYDPTMYLTNNYEKFQIYPKDKPPKRVPKVVFAQDDFGNILKEITSRRINLVENYYEWLRCGFALSHKFGEQGREYFHQISQFGSKYDSAGCDKQYTNCVKRQATNEATIATFYYYVKGAGIPLYSERTKIIAASAIQGKKSGITRESVAKNLKNFEEITGAEDIIDQVFSNDIIISEDGLIPELELFLRQNHDLKRNTITRYIEDRGVSMDQDSLNSIYISAKKVLDKMPYELMDRLIHSRFSPVFNPFHDFFEAHKDRTPHGCIDKLFSSVDCLDTEFSALMFKKWLVGMISSIHGRYSLMMLVFCGGMGTNKTNFFRDLLPDDIKKYYAESKLDAGKDDLILMTQKLIIMDDEYSGKSKKDSKKMRDILAKQWFSLREPYGRGNVDLLRLAVLCGASNEDDIVDDPEHNRRILPIKIFGIDMSIYHSVDKIDLIMEAYNIWQSGWDWTLQQDEITKLQEKQRGFETLSFEKELIQKYFVPHREGLYQEEMTASEIKIFLETKTRQSVIIGKIGKELKSLGFTQKHTDSGRKRVYLVVKIEKDIYGIPDTFYSQPASFPVTVFTEQSTDDDPQF